MFTAPAFALVIVCVVGMVVLATCFKEDYVAMVSDEEKKSDFFFLIFSLSIYHKASKFIVFEAIIEFLQATLNLE